VERHCFDADSDPDLNSEFHFDADPDPDPDRHQHDSDRLVDPTPKFKKCWKTRNFSFFIHSNALLFTHQVT
jgi:hypothetical protein